MLPSTAIPLAKLLCDIYTAVLVPGKAIVIQMAVQTQGLWKTGSSFFFLFTLPELVDVL